MRPNAEGQHLLVRGSETTPNSGKWKTATRMLSGVSVVAITLALVLTDTNAVSAEEQSGSGDVSVETTDQPLETELTPSSDETKVVCGEIYGVGQSRPMQVMEVHPQDGTTVVVGEFETSAQSINGLALDGETGTFWAVEQAGTGKSGNVTEPKIYSLNVASKEQQIFKGADITASAQRSEMIMGAFDPRSGIYYYAQMSEGSIQIYGFDTINKKSLAGRVAIIPLEYGTNGDFAFDSSGHLFIVSDKQLYTVSDPLPTLGSQNPPVLKAKIIAEISQDIYGSAAFGADGRLYVATGDGKVRTIDPASGETLTTLTIDSNGRVSDFASCAQPYTLELVKNLPQGRVNDSDQFELRIDGGGLKSGNVGTTSGEISGLQTGQIDNFAGPVAVLPGAEYTISESILDISKKGSEYTSTWECLADGNPFVQGEGTSGKVTIPQNGAVGATIFCTFTNTPKVPEKLSQWKSSQPKSGTVVRTGQNITYTLHFNNDSEKSIPVTNSDDLSKVLNNAEMVSDPVSSHSSLSVDRNGQELVINGKVPPRTQATVQYTVKIKPLDQRGNNILRNSLSECDDDKTCSTEHPLQQLKVEKGITVSELSLDYQVTVTNVGNADYAEDDPATMVDDLSGVLIKKVEYLGNATATSGTVSYSAPKISWAGPLKVGESVTISYSFERPDAFGGTVQNAACVPQPGEDETCAVIITPIPEVRSISPVCDEKYSDDDRCPLEVVPPAKPSVRATVPPTPTPTPTPTLTPTTPISPRNGTLTPGGGVPGTPTTSTINPPTVTKSGNTPKTSSGKEKSRNALAVTGAVIVPLLGIASLLAGLGAVSLRRSRYQK